MIYYSGIFVLTGWILLVIAIAMLFPMAIDWFMGNADAGIYATTSIFLLLFSSLIIIFNKSQESPQLSIKEAFVMTGLVWGACIFAASFPFVFGSLGLSWTDAIFQVTSMTTTTGANLILDLEGTPSGTLFWCCLLQWLGGQGIIIMALVFLPILRIGGMQLFAMESFSEKTDKFLPRVPQIAFRAFCVYIILTFVCAGMLWGSGFSVFEAICHAMTTLSTGGFSLWDDSITHVNSLWVQFVITLFMYAGGCTFFMFTLLATSSPVSFFRNSQIKTFTKFIMGFSVLIALGRVLDENIPWNIAFVESFFNVTSAITTTGFMSSDYTQWGPTALVVITFLPFIGGCTGSTAGGMKVFRIQLLWNMVISQLKKTRRPHGVFPLMYDGKPVSEAVMGSVSSFFALFIMTYAILSVVLGILGMDFVTATTGAATMLTNFGPGLGDIIGPTGNYAPLPDDVKWVMCGGMILGRLELIPILILCMPFFWKK
jgi:trk system potassium uptake protein TrkH